MQINPNTAQQPKTRGRKGLRHHAKRVRKLSRTPHAVPVITFAVLILVTGVGFLVAHLLHDDPVASTATDNRIVIVSHDNEKQVVPSSAATVGDLLKRLNIKLNEGDVVEPAMKTSIDQDQFRINVYRALPVEVVDGSEKTFAFSAAKTSRSIASQMGKQIAPEDIVQTDPVDDFIKTGAIGQQVVINRAKQVNMNLYGTPVSLKTHADTVGELIAQKKITLAKDDVLTPSADTPLTPNTLVFVTRNGIKIESETQPIAMPVQTISDPNLAYGTNAIRQQGVAGEQIVTYQLQQKNGVTVSKTPLQTVVTKQPVTQVVVVGSSLTGIKGDMARAGIAPGDFNYVDYIVGKESGWRPSARSGSGAYGLCQALPGGKMASAGADWATNPVTQLKWCDGYAKGRYGSWAAAYNYWMSNHYW